MDDRTGMIIDLSRIAYNIKHLKANTPKGTKLAAVVKADAYGHGALNVSKVAIEHGLGKHLLAIVHPPGDLITTGAQGVDVTIAIEVSGRNRHIVIVAANDMSAERFLTVIFPPHQRECPRGDDIAIAVAVHIN